MGNPVINLWVHGGLLATAGVIAWFWAGDVIKARNARRAAKAGKPGE